MGTDEIYVMPDENYQKLIKDNINHRLATEVMGWVEVCEVQTSDRFTSDVYCDKDGVPQYAISRYSPTTDMNQAMMCVEKLEKYWFLLTNHREEWEAMFRERDVPAWEGVANEVGARDKSPALAICKAILEALDNG